jgi:hypothetical protein
MLPSHFVSDAQSDSVHLFVNICEAVPFSEVTISWLIRCIWVYERPTFMILSVGRNFTRPTLTACLTTMSILFNVLVTVRHRQLNMSMRTRTIRN